MPSANPKSQTVVLTGATGFLGSHLCRALVERGHRVHAYHRPQSNLARLGDAAAKVQWHLTPETFSTPFTTGARVDAVIHCAALYGRKNETISDLIAANTLLPVQLFEQAQRHAVPLFLHADTILDPAVNPYARSKHQAVEWLRAAAAEPVRITNLKLQHFYGPGDDLTKFIPAMMMKCLAHEPEIKLTDGQQRRDFIYIDDAVRAIIAVLEQPVSGGHNFYEVEIGNGMAVPIRELVETIHRLAGSRSKLLFGALPHRPGEPMLAQADISALTAMGWHPQISLTDGLQRTLASLT
ncbi:MAG: NAD-dependent epimerase/dehydratase [Verrucomicrobiales bacterium]|nr:NAD-dependent epimerase/dehydratase [Verrucomicrobiales bacterium]